MNNVFNETLDAIGKSDEIQYLKKYIKNPKKQEEIIDFICQNNIDCNHLWEDGEVGDKATEDWHKLVEFALDL